jgi:hypothetical protein
LATLVVREAVDAPFKGADGDNQAIGLRKCRNDAE